MRQQKENHDSLGIFSHESSFRPTPVRKRQPVPIKQPNAKRLRLSDVSPSKYRNVVYATAAQLEQLPTIEIKIRPKTAFSTPPIPKARTSPSSFKAGVQPVDNSLPRPKLPRLSAMPCCLRASMRNEGLLPACACDTRDVGRESAEGKFVDGIENVVKDHWTLKCNICTKTAHKARGARIRCAKGKCPKAFHVSCTRDTADIEFTVTEGQSDSVIPNGELRSGEHVKKQTVTPLCPQHNLRVIEVCKLDKQAKVDADIDTLKQYSKIKVRASGGMFAVTLVNPRIAGRWRSSGTRAGRKSFDVVVWYGRICQVGRYRRNRLSLVHTWELRFDVQRWSDEPREIIWVIQLSPSSSSEPPGPGYPFPEYLRNSYPHSSYTCLPHLRYYHTPPSHTPTPPASDHAGPSYINPFSSHS
ncbi:hypothetical protein FRC12_003157 [Ceratobasidium sp. 428]|nr:hypothetical protein FRC12_003157 [Ceratobasidium sp. 428]